jgi:hypothetical protein
MGLYDTIKIPCPKCGAIYEAQSKSGECDLKIYEWGNVPPEAMADVNRHAPFTCDCGVKFKVAMQIVGTPIICG